MNVKTILAGYRTYALSALTVLALLAGMYTGKVPVDQGVAGIGLALGIGTNRAGSKNDAAKVIAHVTDAATVAAAMAPVVAETVPGLAKEADKVGELATKIGALRDEVQGDPQDPAATKPVA